MSTLEPAPNAAAYLVLVSVSVPFTGSRTVRRRTPFCNPMFTNVVGWVLLIPASSMSAMQIAEGGEVNACILMGSSVVSGSREIMRTVWSSQPTACQIAISHPLTKSTSNIPRRVSSGVPLGPRQCSMPKRCFPSPSYLGIHLTAPQDPIRNKPVPRSSERLQPAACS